MERNIYIGYVQVDDTDSYLKYEIKAYTYKTARIRIKSLANAVEVSTGTKHTVAWLGDSVSVLPAEIACGNITDQGHTIA